LRCFTLTSWLKGTWRTAWHTLLLGSTPLQSAHSCDPNVPVLPSQGDRPSRCCPQANGVAQQAIAQIRTVAANGQEEQTIQEYDELLESPYKACLLVLAADEHAVKSHADSLDGAQ
jgi:hypothetical protein